MSKKINNTEKISFTDVSLPKGGGAIKGIGETFKSNIYTGTGSFSMPIYTSACRGFEPKLSLGYDSGAGSGVFGMGFSISIPNISRKTDKGIPKYDDSDRFILSNSEELVPKLLDNSKELDKRVVEENGVSWKVTVYASRVEQEFSRIELWEGGDSSFWKVTSRDNITSTYGRSDKARISDPENKSHVFQWLIEKTIDEKGNKIEYSYRQENSENIANEIYEKNRDHSTNRYLSKIRYGNYLDENLEEAWAFEVVFDYGEYNIEDDYLRQSGSNPYNSTNKWAARLTPFSSYRSGFEIRTLRLCRNILMFHHFEKELGKMPCLVKATKFKYDESINSCTLLSKVQVMGLSRKNDGSYDLEYMPPIEFTYSIFNPLKESYEELKVEEGEKIPSYINKAKYAFTDLYGEGIDGLLYSDNNTTFYMKPRGEGKYQCPKPAAEFPIERDLNSENYTLTSLDGSGKLDLMVNTPEKGGFYEVNSDGTWIPYTDFKSRPLDLVNPLSELVDLNGDGCSELLILEDNGLKIYPSMKKEGFGPAERSCITGTADEEFPISNNGDKTEFLGFADMFGDGLSHRIRIRNGMLECWPNLGYGCFGKRVLFGNAPKFGEELDISRLFIVDIDGSGAADIAYVYSDRVEIFINKGGNSFEEAIVIPLPSLYDKLSKISFADVKGSGTTALVFSSMGVETKHFYYDFTGGEKPYLLTKVDNNMGGLTLLRYASSVKFYLEDEEAGKPWKTRLPFPVHVLERIETIDNISASKLVTSYKYHDGYYDYVDREFRGFGYVEEWDAESFEANSENDVPPVYTKRWYHTGAYIEEKVLSRQYREEYYNKDANSYLMPDSVLDYRIKNNGETMRQAHRALAGKLLREEVYSVDNKPGLTEHPYFVEELSYEIRQVQPKEDNKNAVFYVYEREKINYQYERNPKDPRIQHTFTLEVDAFGNNKKECQVFYPRREAEYDEQSRLKAIVELSNYINITENSLLLGVPYESKTYEIGGLDLRQRSYFSFEEVQVQLNVALYNVINHDENFTLGEIQGRILSLERSYFWNENQRDCLPFGECTSLALVHHTEIAEFSKEAVFKVFGNKVTNNMLEEHGGYILKDGYWWNRGFVYHYYKKEDNKFYLLWKIENSFAKEDSSLYVKTEQEYDYYSIIPIKEVDYLSKDITNITKSSIDYITLQNKEVIDINGNISQAIFDPLGRVKAISNRGITAGKPQGHDDLKEYNAIANGSFEDVILNPNKYLQKTSAFFYYDLLSWKERKEPARFITLISENYSTDLEGGNESKVQIQVDYTDGFGRNIEKKVKVDSGNAILWDREGNAIEGYAENPWLVSGRTIYNNKAKPMKQYEPFFSSVYDFEGEKAVHPILAPPTVLHYDPLLREIKRDTPKGFFSKVEFTPWEERYFDENDTIKDSKYYKSFMENYPEKPSESKKDEKDALNKAVLFYDTPKITVLDNIGNTFLEIEQPSKDEEETTWYNSDINGNLLTSIDHRLYSSNVAKGTRYYNFKYVYSMSGKILSINSADAGRKENLFNIFGKPVHEWDSRNFHFSTVYDRLQRVTQRNVEGVNENGSSFNNTVEKYIYGEDSGINSCNLRGKVYKQYDEGGVVLFNLYDIKEQPLQISRQLRSDYKNQANWNDISKVLMESESFTTLYTYDALGRVISEKSPDESVTVQKYNQAGLLNKVAISYKEGSTENYIEDIKYNARGQRDVISYGNGVSTRYTYEDTTKHLMNIFATRLSGAPLQNIDYTYDAVGNITRIRDSSHEAVINNQQIVEALSDYTYNGLYKLIKSSGRQHPGIKADAHRYSFKQCGFMAFSTPNVNDGEKLENYYESYNYDGSGNLASIKHVAPSGSWTRNMEIAADSNRAVKVSSINGDLDSYSPSYDGNGNTQSLENLRNLTWNYRNNIASADVILRDGSSSDSEYYVYDSNGTRIRKVSERKVSSTVTEREEKIYLGNFEIKRIKRISGTTESTILDRQSIHVMDGETRVAIINLWLKDDNKREIDQIGIRKCRYHHSNHLGSTSMETDEEASIISYEEYFPFGGTSIIAGKSEREVNIKEYRYAGKERDDVTGLYYYGARYYASWLGRWLSPDPAGTIDGLNLYAFVCGNPVNFTDYNGYGKVKGENKPLSTQAQKKPRKSTLMLSRFGRSRFKAAVRQMKKRRERARKVVAVEQNYVLFNKTHAGSQPVPKKVTQVEYNISKLNNTGIFRSGTLEHILEGELNAKGKAVGFHYEGMPTAKGNIIQGTKAGPNPFGVYTARVEVNGVLKVGNGGFSTFFPESYTPQNIIDSINEAYSSRQFIQGTSNTFIGQTSSGIIVEMYIDSSTSKIISAFPKYWEE
jgi:RHS repeat-associated protein